MKVVTPYHVVLTGSVDGEPIQTYTWKVFVDKEPADAEAEYLRARGFFKQGLSVEVKSPVAIVLKDEIVSANYLYDMEQARELFYVDSNALLWVDGVSENAMA